MIPLGILAVLSLTVPLASAIAQKVPDEVAGSRKYLGLAVDGVFLIAIAIVLARIHIVLAIAAVLAAALIRVFRPIQQGYPLASGVLAGLGISLSLGSGLLLLLTCNYLSGLFEGRRHKIRLAFLQPIAAIATLLVL